MINHVRTLLLNASWEVFVNIPGSEYVPKEYKKIDLPGDLQRAHCLFFGDSPDALMLNLRARQLLSVVEASPLANFVFQFDPRITYSLRDPLDISFGISVFGGKDKYPFIFGDFNVANSSGKCSQSYTLYIKNDIATLTRTTPPLRQLVVPAVYAQGISSSINLPETSLLVQWPQVEEALWRIEITSPPAKSPEELVRHLDITDFEKYYAPYISSEEPWPTFIATWQQSKEGLNNLAALVLGFAYAVEKVRYAGN